MKEVAIAMILPFCLGFVVGMSFIIAIELKKMDDKDRDYNEDEEY